MTEVKTDIRHREAPYKCLQVLKVDKNITIREYSNGQKRYFRAVIMGWRNFKFFSDVLKPQEVLERTAHLCKSFAISIKRDEDNVKSLPSEVNFTA